MNKKFLSDKVIELAKRAGPAKTTLSEVNMENWVIPKETIYSQRKRCLKVINEGVDPVSATELSFSIFLEKVAPDLEVKKEDLGECIMLRDENGILFATIETEGDYAKIVERGKINGTPVSRLLKAYALTVDKKYEKLLK